MNLDDIKQLVGFAIIRFLLVLIPALVIQLGALYVVWDALNSRMGDLSAQQVQISTQLGQIREDVGFLKAKIAPLDFSQIDTPPESKYSLSLSDNSNDIKELLDAMGYQMQQQEMIAERIVALKALREHEEAKKAISDFVESVKSTTRSLRSVSESLQSTPPQPD